MLVDSYPLLTPVLEIAASEDGGQLRVSTLVSRAGHPYLRDHVFGGVSLVPGASMIETACQAVRHFADYWGLPVEGLPDLEQFEILRAIGLRGDASIELRTWVRRVPAADMAPGALAFDVEITSDATNAEGRVVRRDRKHFVARAVMYAKRILPSPIPIDVPGEWFDAPPPEALRHEHYRTRTRTHGPMMYGLTGRMELTANKDSVVAEIALERREVQFVRDNPRPMLVSPLGLDCVAQLHVMLGQSGGRSLRLPVRGAGVHMHRPLDTSSRLYARVDIRADDGVESVSRIVVTDRAFVPYVQFDSLCIRGSSVMADMDLPRKSGRTSGE